VRDRLLEKAYRAQGALLHEGGVDDGLGFL
jgi:hypothetical protein